ncbi:MULTISPECIES: S1C family serine protease [unclassified Luteococcus]|uniref:S1C family serine protease n=1 Tax=unclassified Luteococcus TaxID=2639923 RepID=UPI00313C25AC
MDNKFRADDLTGDEPTRALLAQPRDDAEWFWSRPQEAQDAEPTRVIGGQDEQTLQLPLAMSAAIGSAAATAAQRAGSGWGQGSAGHVAPPAAAPSFTPAQPVQTQPLQNQPVQTWGAPSGQPVQPVPASAAQPSRTGGKALLAVFAASLLAGTAILQGPALLSSGSQPQAQPSVGQPEESGQSGQDQQSGADGQSGQDQQGQQDGGGTPAEGRPWDPWQQVEQGSGVTNEQQAGSQQTTASAAQSKGVVLINTTTAAGQGAGSGMVITSNGYVLTNYHVVQSSTRVQVQVASTRKTYVATVVGHDASNDVALLKLEGAENLETVTIDDDQVRAGDSVTAVGNANGQGYLSAAAGTVTDTSSSITVTNESSASGREELTDVLKTTAGAQPGDSGGPMYDAEGEVLGMTTAGQTASSGIRTQNTTIASYAVPIERAMGIIKQIQAGKESGSVKVGPNAYLGVSVRTLDDGSLVVASVVSGGPAEQAGIGRGDVITGIGGTAVDSHATLSEQLAERNPGDTVAVTWLDELGQRHQAEVSLGSSPVN